MSNERSGGTHPMLAKMPSSAQELIVNGRPDITPDVIDGGLYGEPLFKLSNDLYIPPDALEIFLESFEGALDLLLYLSRKQNFNIFDIPMAQVTKQYLQYAKQIRIHNLELAAEYLLMTAMLIQIKSSMLLPVHKADTGEEAKDPRAELVRYLFEYEKMKLRISAARRIAATGPWAATMCALMFMSISSRTPWRAVLTSTSPTCCAVPSWQSITRSATRNCRCTKT